ncbi:MAG: stage V sporulation protein E [Zetaproteobacteria bacterium]|nr:stage V sporulation protein E [Pseudobdellovibrionaceae bacterium]
MGAQNLAPKKLAEELIITTVLLTLLGLLFIYTSSALKSIEIYNTPLVFFYKQFFGACLGFLLITIFFYLPFTWVEKLATPFLLFSFVTLSLIYVPNLYSKAGGAYRWLNLGFIRFQPSELTKLSLIFFLAKNLSRKTCNIKSIKSSVLTSLVPVTVFSFFLMQQPDFGSTALLWILTAVMLFIAGLPRKLIFWGIFLLALCLCGAILSAPYRLQRLTSFLDPWANISSGGFQIIQSYLAFKNGGSLGVGLGLSKQKLFFLPEAHTDFVLSVVSEETGLLGTISVALIFLYMITTGYRIALCQKEQFRKFLAFGLTSMIAIQASLNFLVVTGLLPTKGIPLPFLSSGISCLVTFLLVIALLANIARNTQKVPT